MLNKIKKIMGYRSSRYAVFKKLATKNNKVKDLNINHYIDLSVVLFPYDRISVLYQTENSQNKNIKELRKTIIWNYTYLTLQNVTTNKFVFTVQNKIIFAFSLFLYSLIANYQTDNSYRIIQSYI